MFIPFARLDSKTNRQSRNHVESLMLHALFPHFSSFWQAVTRVRYTPVPSPKVLCRSKGPHAIGGGINHPGSHNSLEPKSQRNGYSGHEIIHILWCLSLGYKTKEREIISFERLEKYLSKVPIDSTKTIRLSNIHKLSESYRRRATSRTTDESINIAKILVQRDNH